MARRCGDRRHQLPAEDRVRLCQPARGVRGRRGVEHRPCTGTSYQGGQVTYADVTGDARADMIFHKSDNTIWVSVATPSGFSARSQWAAPGGAHKSDQASFADIDGDGKADLVFRKSNNQVGVYLSTGSELHAAVKLAGHGRQLSAGATAVGRRQRRRQRRPRLSERFHVVQYDQQNLLHARGNPAAQPVCPSGYTQLAGRLIAMNEHVAILMTPAHRCYRDCRNCDDRQDLKVGLSTGAGFATPTTWIGNLVGGNGDYHADQVKLGDLNGDGKSDLVFRAGSNTLKVALSTGTAFGGLTDWVSFGGSYYAGQAQLADLNGDGKSDVVFRAVSTGCSNVRRHATSLRLPADYARLERQWSTEGI